MFVLLKPQLMLQILYQNYDSCNCKEETGCVKEKLGDDSFVYHDNHPFADIVITFSLAQCEWNLP